VQASDCISFCCEFSSINTTQVSYQTDLNSSVLSTFSMVRLNTALTSSETICSAPNQWTAISVHLQYFLRFLMVLLLHRQTGQEVSSVQYSSPTPINSMLLCVWQNTEIKTDTYKHTNTHTHISRSFPANDLLIPTSQRSKLFQNSATPSTNWLTRYQYSKCNDVDTSC